MMRGFGYPQGTGFDAGVRCLETSVARRLPIEESRVPAAVARHRIPRRDRYLSAVKSWCGGGRPEEAGELPGDGDGGDVCGLAAGPHPPVDAVKPLLGPPGDLQDVVGLAGLAVFERDPDPRLACVMPGRLDQEPPRDPRAGLRDRTLALALPGLVERRRQPQPRAEPPRRAEALPVAGELEVEHERGQRVDAAERPQPSDRRPQPLVLRQPREALVE